jgi:hypothetical protein
MNQGIIRITFDTDGHPEETVLYLAFAGELSDQDAAQIEAHTRDCRLCQTHLMELERGFAVYEEYRTNVLLPEVQPEPQSFRDFPTRLRELSEERVSESGVRKQTPDFWRRLFPSGVAVRWVSVTAAVMAVVILVTETLLNPARLSAAELLERAAAFQNSSAVHTAGGKRKQARQRVRISSGPKAVVRDFQWRVGGSIPNARWQDEADLGKWSAPLTAEGFSLWRNSLAQKKDRVKRNGEQWTLGTTASGNTIREAWIVVRANDFRPTEQHILFSDDRRLDFEELAFEVTEEQAVERPLRETQDVAGQQPASRTQPSIPKSADLSETELQIRYVMFQKEWDLGEDLEIAKTGNDIAVSGVASSQERAQAMREALGQIASVQLDISSPPVSQVGGPPAIRDAPDLKNASPLLKDALEKVFPIPEQRRDFVDSCLAASDNALAHASALVKLAERYDAGSEASLTLDSQSKLREMLRIHLQRLRAADTQLDPLIQFLTTQATGSVAAGTGTWRDAMRTLFTQVREQDSLTTALVAGSQSVTATSERMKFVHNSIHNLLLHAQALVNASSGAK